MEIAVVYWGYILLVQQSILLLQKQGPSIWVVHCDMRVECILQKIHTRAYKSPSSGDPSGPSLPGSRLCCLFARWMRRKFQNNARQA